jgi:hypothetical protein
MRSDHSAAEYSTDYSSPGSAIPLSPPTLGDDDDSGALALGQSRPLARITFCFAWLFGLEAFLSSGTNEQSPSGIDRRM